MKHATRGPVYNGLVIHLAIRKPDIGMAHRNQTLHCHLIKQISKNYQPCYEICPICPYTFPNKSVGFWWFGDYCMRKFYRIIK